MLESEEGHLIPTFKLAKRLVERGHRVAYLCLADSGDYVRRQGLEMVPILESRFPLGSLATLREHSRTAPGSEYDLTKRGLMSVYPGYFEGLVRGELDGVMRELSPDLVVGTPFYGVSALVMRFRYRLPVALVNPVLRTFPKTAHAAAAEEVLGRLRGGMGELLDLVERVDPKARSFKDITARLLGMPELLLCPADFELPEWRFDREPGVHYVEPSVDLERREDREFPWDRVDPSRRLLYCSFGSRSHYGKKIDFFRAVIGAMAGLPGWQLVLSTGGQIGDGVFPDLPDNVLVSPWVPQLEALRRSRLMITHGGLGGVKECILHGVPMIVCPVESDQPDNATRVVRHGLGLRGEVDGATPEGIRALVEACDQDPAIRANADRMRRRFLEVEEDAPGVRLIEQMLASRAG